MSNGLDQPGGSQPGGSQPGGAQPGTSVEGGGMQPVVGRKPLTRKISAKSIVYAVSGPEQPYPHYQFSDRQFFAKPNHNPFKDL